MLVCSGISMFIILKNSKIASVFELCMTVNGANPVPLFLF
jgi:hypothetical protein